MIEMFNPNRQDFSLFGHNLGVLGVLAVGYSFSGCKLNGPAATTL